MCHRSAEQTPRTVSSSLFQSLQKAAGEQYGRGHRKVAHERGQPNERARPLIPPIRSANLLPLTRARAFGVRARCAFSADESVSENNFATAQNSPPVSALLGEGATPESRRRKTI